MNSNQILKKNKTMITRRLEGEAILVPLGKSSKDVDCIYSLNETAAEAWKAIDGKRNLGQIKKQLLKKFDVDEKKLEKELNTFIKDLKSIKAINA